MSTGRAGIAAGEAAAKLAAAGIAVWGDFNRLEVSGSSEPLDDFLGAASGPGFIDWRLEWHSDGQRG
jgi:hypothetical protein